jgi:purine-binding chemotaxis protein CheW
VSGTLPAALFVERALGQPGGAAPERGAGRGGERQRAASPSPIVELCVFRVGEEEYVIDLRRIREILQPLPITPVPSAPEFLAGVMNLRGDVIPVVDVRKRLGVSEASARSKVLIVNVAGRLIGLVVDAVAEVARIPRSEIGPPPLLRAGGPRLFLGVCAGRERPNGQGPARQRLRLLLNVKALLEPAPAGAAVPAIEP